MSSNITPEQLAESFSQQVRRQLTQDEIDQVNASNAAATGDTCHTHDFCDANELMLDAFKALGVDCVFDENQIDLINRAWAIAKTSGFSLGQKASSSPQCTYIFADRTAKMNHYTVTASKPSEAIKLLVMEHGQQPYRIVNIIRAN